MKLFDKRTERTAWIGILISIPFLFFVLLKQNGKFGLTELIITITSLMVGIGIIYFTKWYANK